VASDARYDSIGIGYARVRQPDVRIARQIHAALGSARRVLNVGAGAGSYEPTDRAVVAVEPSRRMIEQRPPDASRHVVRAFAGDLPFRDDAFDAAMALLTVHHWPDAAAGLTELRRVTAGPIVVLTFDYAVHASQWLVTDYLPSMLEFDSGCPSPSEIAGLLGGGEVSVVPVPADCSDGFCHAWWKRPDAYLDPAARAGISGIARLPANVVDAGMARLAEDLASGRWHDKHADLLTRSEIDAGYRLVLSA
jgi:SAM-dependent methyltransferase